MNWKKNRINAAIQVLPEGEGKLKYELVDTAIDAIQNSRINYQVCPFETVVECTYEEFIILLENIHDSCNTSGAQRMITNVKIQVEFNRDVFIEDKMEKYR